MLRSTHQKIAYAITRELGFRNLFLDRKAVWPDNPYNKRSQYPGNIDISLDEHHNIEINRDRILKLILYANKCYKPYDYDNTLFHYLNALHFLCDSTIPSLYEISKQEQKDMGKLYEGVKINPDWNDISKEQLNKSDVKDLIDTFLDDMPVNSNNKDAIAKTMKKTYQNGLKLAKFTFSVERILLEKTCGTCGKLYFHEHSKSKWCKECVQKMLNDLKSGNLEVE